MFDDLKKLLGNDADPSQFAAEMQQLSNNGRFDPFALFAGESRLHSVFIAPFSPALAEARTQFLADGTGPLAGIAQRFQQQGVAAAEAQQAAQAMFSAAQAMCVVVMANDQGLDSIPQLFFGALDDAFIDHALKTAGEAFPHADALRTALTSLRQRATDGVPWWHLHTGTNDDTTYWADLAEQLVGGLDGGVFGAPPERLRDLAWWVGAGATGAEAAGKTAGKPIAPARQPAVLRCVALGGDPDAAFARLERCFADLEDEDLVRILHQVTDVAVARGAGAAAAAWIATHAEAMIERIGDAYDVRASRFKALASTGVTAETLLPAANDLIAADRKTARHELTREPIWRVTAADPGDLIDTAAAADLVGRSPAFVAKRLEQGTIPTVRQDDQVRLPHRALVAWKVVMDAHGLLGAG